MRFRIRIKNLHAWHDWFAWRPVKISCEEWVWLETIKRRRYGTCDNYSWIYMYLDTYGKYKENL